MTRDKERLAAIARLNKERTQGKWLIHFNAGDKVRPCSINEDGPYTEILYITETRGPDVRNANAQFIARAPQMADLCLEQAEEIERLREAIRYAVEDMKHRMDIDYDNRELKKAKGYPLSCAGEKHDDGTYTFPMGNGAWIGLEKVLSDARGG